ncbi:MAG: hypothetical protein Q7S33_04070 [Nanoarchaeota archaeon]|nr:hypothetical protein [Nanoarchaeota archaeon]
MMTSNINIEKYMKTDIEDGKKKNYTLYLKKKNVEFIRKNLKVSLSFVIDDFLDYVANQIKQELREEKSQKRENET